MNEREEYLKIGEQMICEDVFNGASELLNGYPNIAIPMMKFLDGEISWDEQIEIIVSGLDKKI